MVPIVHFTPILTTGEKNETKTKRVGARRIPKKTPLGATLEGKKGG